MVSLPISFRCPHCSIVLTVSPQQAGIEGPCPKCARTIRAPIPLATQGYQPYFPGQASLGPSSRPAAAPHTVASPKNENDAEMPGAVRITPRYGPVKSPPRATATPVKEKPDPSGQREVRPKRGRETRHIPTRVVLRSLMPLIFAGITGVLILGVMKVLKRQGISSDPAPSIAATSAATTPESKDADKSGKLEQPVVPVGTPTTNPTSPTPQAAALDEAALRPSAATEALAVLERFLYASSLEERIPIIETKEPEGSLADSLLASRLPSHQNLVIASQESFPLENIVDFYFTFDFINPDGSPSPQTAVVRRRGGINPRVLADPFLDLYGGRLAAFAAKPQSKGQFFYAIVNPMPSCNDLRIPDRHKKLTLRLFSHEQSPDVTLAYTSRISKIGEILSSGNYDLSYGKPKACVILLGWNTEESPDAPYLEALDITSFHWNP